MSKTPSKPTSEPENKKPLEKTEQPPKRKMPHTRPGAIGGTADIKFWV